LQISSFAHHLYQITFGGGGYIGLSGDCFSGDPRRPRYPVSAVRIPDGKGYKFTGENVAALLQLSMKDVTPKG